MKSIQIIFFLLFTTILFGACKTVKIEDGRVPNKYLSHAKKLEGSYSGEFNGVSGNLVISFEGDRPAVTYKNRNGSDILNNDCRSRIGHLLKVTVKSERKRPYVSSALFDFDSGNCSLLVAGRDLSIGFKDTDKGMRATVTLLKELRQRQVCEVNPGNPPHVPPSQRCSIQHEPVYIYGRFYR